MSNVAPNELKLEYLTQTQSHIHENIIFSDQKAAVFITVNLGIFGGLYSAGMLTPAQDAPQHPWCAALASALLLLSAGLCSWVLKPRGVALHKSIPGTKGNTSVPEKISTKQLDAFIAEFDDLKVETMIADLAALVHTRSVINDQKYEWLDRGIWCSFAAWAASIVLVVAMLFPCPKSVTERGLKNGASSQEILPIKAGAMASHSRPQ